MMLRSFRRWLDRRRQWKERRRLTERDLWLLFRNRDNNWRRDFGR